MEEKNSGWGQKCSKALYYDISSVTSGVTEQGVAGEGICVLVGRARRNLLSALLSQRLLWFYHSIFWALKSNDEMR